jgi:hypothetical protein
LNEEVVNDEKDDELNEKDDELNEEVVNGKKN